MRTYKKHPDGSYSSPELVTFQKLHISLYNKMISEIQSGDAEIVEVGKTLSKSQALIQINSHYDYYMLKLQGDYSDQEVKTFHAQLSSARSKIIAGNATPEDLEYLEDLEGETGKKAQRIRAEKIINAATTFNKISAKMQRLRNDHKYRLKDSGDNQHLVDSLIQSYEKIMNPRA